MRPSSRLTPYPVLSTWNDDYLDASFATTIEAEQKFGSISLVVTLDLDEPALMGLLEDGLACFAIHLECPSSSYREVIRTRESLVAETLDRQRVREVIEVCTFVVATERIEGFSSPHFHPDYEGLAFDIDPGGVLAVGTSQQIAVESKEDLERHASVFNVSRASDAQKDAISVNTDASDVVLVSLKPDLYRIYAELGNGPESDTILSLVMLPALAAVLTRMMESGADPDGGDADKEWFKSIEEILRRNKIDLSDLDNYSESKSALAIAQQIFNQPIERALRSIALRED